MARSSSVKVSSTNSSSVPPVREGRWSASMDASADPSPDPGIQPPWGESVGFGEALTEGDGDGLGGMAPGGFVL